MRIRLIDWMSSVLTACLRSFCEFMLAYYPRGSRRDRTRSDERKSPVPGESNLTLMTSYVGILQRVNGTFNKDHEGLALKENNDNNSNDDYSKEMTIIAKL